MSRLWPAPTPRREGHRERQDDAHRGQGRGLGRAARLRSRVRRRRVRRGALRAETLNDILGLIGYCATTETIESWTLRQRVDALVYAANVSARASDNVVRRCPRPDWFPEHPWRGPEIGEAGTIFGGPGPTPIERTSPEVSADTSTSKGRTE